MAGHSKWANIKHQKQAEDRKRAKEFSKLSKLITRAVKEGGSDDPDKNVALRQVIDRAKDADMPKDNINRAIENAFSSMEDIEEFSLEGYGPDGVAIYLKIESDNRTRTVQEVKNIFDRNKGNLAEPGAVKYRFDQLGKVVTSSVGENELLELIEFGVDSFDEEEDEIVFWLIPDMITDFVLQCEQRNVKVKQAKSVLKPKDTVELSSGAEADCRKLVSSLEEREDVVAVFTNLKK